MHTKDDRLDACVNMQILRASHRILQRFDEAYRPYGIRATQLPVLALVARLGPITLKELAERTGGERSALSRKLRVMVAHGWVQETGSGRAKRYTATAAGKTLLAAVEPVRDAVQAELMARLSPEEGRQFLALCERLIS